MVERYLEHMEDGDGIVDNELQELEDDGKDVQMRIMSMLEIMEAVVV